MRWTARQHLEMALRLDEKARLATDPKKARLASLAAALGIVARQRTPKEQEASLLGTEFDPNVYRHALPHFYAGIQHLAHECADPREILRALIAHLVGMGLDAEEIRYCKPYVKRFTGYVVNRRSRHRQWPPFAQALFCPSFDAETSIRVTAEPDHTVLALTSAEGLFGPQLTQQSIVASNCALRFWARLDEILAAPFDLEHRIGFDGITIKVNCRTPAGQKHFQVWSPEPTSHPGMLIGLIYDLAQEASTAPAAIRCLERLRSYVRDSC